MALTKDEIEKIAKERATAIVTGLVGCSCIKPALAEVLEKVVERAKAEAKSHVEHPYGESKEIHDYYKSQITDLNAAEDALKSLELCDS
jgi:hypothetical protein